MKKAVFAAIITIVAGLFCMALAKNSLYNFDEFGAISAVAVMGGFIIYFNEQKKKKGVD